MSAVKVVVIGAVVLVLQVGVALAQYPGEVSPFGPSSSDVIGNMNFTFKVYAPNEVVREAQMALKEEGYYAGPIDGVLSPAVRTAIWDFQRAKGMTPTACLDRVTVAALGLGGGAAYASPPSFAPPPSVETRQRPPAFEIQAP
jgi:peptidoglycan hydrolase-like protein with peptidoglycan-binding domain